MRLTLYMLRRFFLVFAASVFFFTLLLELTDFLLNLWNYISHGVELRDIALIALYYIPKAVCYSVPIAVLFAATYVLSGFYANNELLAVFASGVSLRRFSAPLLFVSLAMSFALFAFEDNIAVPIYARKMRLQQRVLSTETSQNNTEIVIMAEGGNIIYNADFFDADDNVLSGLLVIFRGEDKSFDALIYAPVASWTGEAWQLEGGIELRARDNGLYRTVPEARLVARLNERPETFRNNTTSVEEVSTEEARQYIAHLERAGLPAAEAKSVYYKKYAAALVVFLAAFFAIGCCGKTRKNVLIVSGALSVGAVVLFYVFQMMTMLAARFGVIPPVCGAWVPVAVFAGAAGVLLAFAKT